MEQEIQFLMLTLLLTMQRRIQRKKRLTGKRLQAHHTSAESGKSGRIYTWKYKNFSVVIKVAAIEWQVDIEDKVHIT